MILNSTKTPLTVFFYTFNHKILHNGLVLKKGKTACRESFLLEVSFVEDLT